MKPQTLEPHERVALVTVGHEMPQPPQLLTSFAEFTSHPLLVTLSQFLNAPLHAAMAHAPPVQLLTALARLQTLPQVPQLLVSAAEFTSQPLA